MLRVSTLAGMATAVVAATSAKTWRNLVKCMLLKVSKS